MFHRRQRTLTKLWLSSFSKSILKAGRGRSSRYIIERRAARQKIRTRGNKKLDQSVICVYNDRILLSSQVSSEPRPLLKISCCPRSKAP
jgi:hypothetical protein